MRWNGLRRHLLEPFEREGQVRSALRAGDRVHLVDDHRLDPAEHLARLRREEQEQRLGRGDQDVGRVARHLAPLALIGVARANADGQRRTEADERGTQVALDVVVERLERRDVEQAQPLARVRVESVDPGEECREGLAGAGRRLHEDVRSGRDHGPRCLLGGRRPGEDALEPGPRRGCEGGERIHPPRVSGRRVAPGRSG